MNRASELSLWVSQSLLWLHPDIQIFSGGMGVIAFPAVKFPQ